MPTPDDMDSADDDDDDDFDPDERPKVQPPLLKPLGDTPELKKVLARAARGDTSVLPAVRKLLTDPAVQRLLGDVAEQACDRLIFVVSGDDLAVSEAVRIHTQAMLTNLLADSSAKASFLEQVAARRVIHTWLAVHALEILWAMKQSGTDSAERIARHLCTAERRLEAAMKSLAVLRRLALPAITAQLNVATGSMVVNNHATSSSNAEGIDAP